MAGGVAFRLSGLPVVSSNSFALALLSFVAALIFVRIIHACALRSKHVMARGLEYQPIVYVGKISYGIYVYHNFVEELSPKFFQVLGLAFPVSFIPKFVLLTAITLLLSSLSWHAIEKPINALKNRHSG